MYKRIDTLEFRFNGLDILECTASKSKISNGLFQIYMHCHLAAGLDLNQ